MMQERMRPPIDPGTRIGHVHLKVSDLERAVDFYCGVLGFQVTQRYGVQAAFVSAGGYHHHIGLNTWESLGGPPPPTYNGAVPSRHSVSNACCVGRRFAKFDISRNCVGRRQRPRRERSLISDGPGWEWLGIVLGSSAG